MLCWQMHTFCRQLRIVHETWGKALPEDAKVKLRKDECAFSMRRHGQKRNVAVEWRVHKYTLEKCSMKHMHKHYRQRRSVYEYEAWGVTNPKKLCSHEGCANLAINGGVYMKHGTKTKRCSSDGCTWGMGQWPNYAAHATDVPIKWSITIEEFVDRRHKAKMKLCNHEGCTNQVVTGGACINWDKPPQSRSQESAGEKRHTVFGMATFFYWRQSSLLSDWIRGSYYLLTVSQYSETLKREEIDVYIFLLETICQWFFIFRRERRWSNQRLTYPLHFAYHSQ